jgi:hypothetical protein
MAYQLPELIGMVKGQSARVVDRNRTAHLRTGCCGHRQQ